MIPWWKRLLRREQLRPDREWKELCERLPILEGYSGQEMDRLHALTVEFLDSKDIQGAGGLELSGGMCRLIALQACVPVLNLGLAWYRGWVQVLVYPDEFLARDEYQDEAGVVHEGSYARIGESWAYGPVILSWRHSAQDAFGGEGGNVVIHEFVHKLDVLNGGPNGMPPLHKGMRPEAWTRDFEHAYDDFLHRCERGQSLPFDEYAAADPGEFFAVVSEAFFVQPSLVRAVYPQVYAHLAQFYRQEPHARAAARQNIPPAWD